MLLRTYLLLDFYEQTLELFNLMKNIVARRSNIVAMAGNSDCHAVFDLYLRGRLYSCTVGGIESLR